MIYQRPTFLTLRLVCSVGFFVSLAGCANIFNPVGENKYDCNRKENPDSPYCHSFKSVEQATTKDVPASRYDEQMSIEDIDKLTGIAPVKKSENTDKNSVSNQNIFVFAVDSPVSGSSLPAGTPVRVGPVVQRTWVKSFNDKNDMLTSDQVIYKEVVPPHWAGEIASRTTQGITAGGLPGTYPHRPAAPSPPLLNTSPVPASDHTDRNESNTSFIQPETQVPVSETASALADNSVQSMPN